MRIQSMSRLLSCQLFFQFTTKNVLLFPISFPNFRNFFRTTKRCEKLERLNYSLSSLSRCVAASESPWNGNFHLAVNSRSSSSAIAVVRCCRMVGVDTMCAVHNQALADYEEIKQEERKNKKLKRLSRVRGLFGISQVIQNFCLTH